MKKCSRCKQELDDNLFGPNRAHNDGLNNECRLCAKISQKNTSRLNKNKNKNGNGNVIIKLKNHCRTFANKREVTIQDVLELSKRFNSLISEQELE